jgi:eukaryotic-like serine/threonine-protein kinase
MPLEKLGPYKLEKILGRGGMGAVYVGLNEQTGERAAVKVLSGHLADDEAFRERFKIEVETLKRLSHPNIVQLSGYGEDDGHLFYVMELVKGKSLHDELAAGRRFTWREATRIGIAVAQALKHAHDRGIIHRDLKPANLLIDEQDHVKLTDFGIAKLYGGTSVTADGGVLGTADYMAPEQADGKQVTARCDLYALGSVLYALLAGRPPFTGKTVMQVITALKNEKPVPLRRLAPDTPDELESIVLQLLEKDPQKRIPTALVLANRLKAMEHALSVETRVVLPGETDDNDELRLAPDDRPPDKTQPVGQTARHAPSKETRPLPAEQAPAGGPPGLSPTMVTGISKPAAPMPSQGTQATGNRAGIHKANTVSADEMALAPEAPPDRKTHFTAVSEAELRRRERPADSDDVGHRTWITAGILLAAALAILGAVVVYAARPPPADQLYAQIKQAADDGGGEALVGVESEMTRFVESFAADPRAEEVRGWQQELELYRLEKRFERRARQSAGVADLLPIERAYFDAQQLAARDPERALARFQAILAVFDGPADSSLNKLQQAASAQVLELARKQVESLKKTVEQLKAEERQALRRQLERAKQLAAKDRPAAAKIWQGIVTLYSDKAWAKDLVEQAQAQLAEKE